MDTTKIIGADKFSATASMQEMELNMPFYDLRCVDCDKEFNIKASMTEKTERRIPCPECGSLKMETVYISAPAFIKSKNDSMPSCHNRSICGNSGCRH